MKTIRKKTTGYKEENLKEDIIQEALDAGGGGGGTSFIDITELPTENIDKNSIYRLFEVYGVYNNLQNTTVHIVDTLPTTGENCTIDGSYFTNMYYNTTDESVYGYVDATLATAFGITAGWYPASALMTIEGLTYGGVIDDPEEIEEDTLYFIKRYTYYNYIDKWNVIKDDYYLIAINNFTDSDTLFIIMNSSTDTRATDIVKNSKEIKINGGIEGTAYYSLDMTAKTIQFSDSGYARYDSSFATANTDMALTTYLLLTTRGITSTNDNRIVLSASEKTSLGLIKLYAK